MKINLSSFIITILLISQLNSSSLIIYDTVFKEKIIENIQFKYSADYPAIFPKNDFVNFVVFYEVIFPEGTDITRFTLSRQELLINDEPISTIQDNILLYQPIGSYELIFELNKINWNRTFSFSLYDTKLSEIYITPLLIIATENSHYNTTEQIVLWEAVLIPVNQTAVESSDQPNNEFQRYIIYVFITMLIMIIVLYLIKKKSKDNSEKRIEDLI
ncbi:MAG: hypothetical protein OEZ01_02110 [Candidatus Heimdallarchaeota archaeon]|nr:hypothetical protein [Candidatus Heimdallarchaeota archaeon]MDH5644769.1 hypothetical protein [Candidatus Heimdallarchaeota archaeon]